MTRKLGELRPKQERLLNQLSAQTDDKGAIIFAHSSMCQTALPVKDQGKELSWTSQNGGISLNVESRKVLTPQGEWVNLGLPYGAKPRLILAYLNTKAIQAQSPIIDVQRSLRAFLLAMGLDARGQDFKVVKQQLAKLAASDISIGRIIDEHHTSMTSGRVIKQFDLWFPKNENQTLLWESEIVLSWDYFEGLVKHAVPLKSDALLALKDSALELDLYAMLAERLHRIKTTEHHYVYWSVLHKQYGTGYKRIRAFRDKFNYHLANVRAAYPDARIDTDEGGLRMYHSFPPVRKNYVKGHSLK